MTLLACNGSQPVYCVMVTFVPQQQWPPDKHARTRLAVYLMRDMLPKPDVLHLLTVLASGINGRAVNGMIEIAPNIVVEACLVYAAAPEPGATVLVSPDRLIGLAFHCLWQVYGANAPHVLACVVYQFQLTARNTSFAAALYAHVSPLIAVGPKMQAAMAIGRPDLIHFMQQAYMTWLCRVKRPELIEEALHLLMVAPWQFDTAWPVYTMFERHVEHAGIQCAVPRGQHSLSHAPTTVYSKTRAANVYINNWPALVISHRDWVLLILLFLWHPDSAWTRTGVPAHAPACFAGLQSQQPYLFDLAQPPPPCLFDEVSI